MKRNNVVVDWCSALQCEDGTCVADWVDRMKPERKVMGMVKGMAGTGQQQVRWRGHARMYAHTFTCLHAGICLQPFFTQHVPAPMSRRPVCTIPRAPASHVYRRDFSRIPSSQLARAFSEGLRLSAQDIELFTEKASRPIGISESSYSPLDAWLTTYLECDVAEQEADVFMHMQRLEMHAAEERSMLPGGTLSTALELRCGVAPCALTRCSRFAHALLPCAGTCWKSTSSPSPI